MFIGKISVLWACQEFNLAVSLSDSAKTNPLPALKFRNQHQVWTTIAMLFLLDNLIELVKCVNTKKKTLHSTYNVKLRLQLPFSGWLQVLPGSFFNPSHQMSLLFPNWILKKRLQSNVAEMGVSWNWGTPKWLVHNGKSHLEMDDELGVPLFSEKKNGEYF